MSAATFKPRGLRVGNSNCRVGRVQTASEDFSLFDQKENLNRIKVNLESSAVATTLLESKFAQIANVFLLKEPLIQNRNDILDNPFKYYNPYYRIKLKRIDTLLDDLDMQLYILETENQTDENDLDCALALAESKLKKYSKYFEAK